MSQNLRQSISELEARAKLYDSAAAKSRQAAQQLRELLQLDAPAGKATRPSAPSTKMPASKGKAKQKSLPAKKTKAKINPRSASKPTLAAAITHVLETRQREKAGGVKATQLYEEIHDAGYRFSGQNKKNNMTYLYKILRANKARFQHADDGTFSMKA